MNKEEIYTKVRANWNEQFSKEVSAKLIWQRVSIGLCIILIVLIFAVIKVSSQSKVMVWIVEVDSVGRAVAVGPAMPIETNDERIIKAHLFNFVELSRSVIGDPQAMRRNLDRIYKLVTPEVRNYLNTYYKANNPMESARSISKEIEIQSFLKETNKTFIVEWKEITRDLNNKVIEESRYKGLFIISQPKTVKEIENPNNPFGIIITNVSWSKVM